jgi:hypothetical protein
VSRDVIVNRRGIYVQRAGGSGGGGTGNVVGPASAVSGDLAVFDGITGKVIKDGRHSLCA